MRLLVLNVDRDNDLGRKTDIQGPVIGREAVLKAATALAVADPEEADANGMFAAVKEYDEIVHDPTIYGADAVFVAAATGHIREGTHADAVIAHQIDQIMAATQADHVILVSDGGEDEHLMPILQTRLKVDGVRRVIVKQAKNLEGAFYLFNRLLHDEKLQVRFFLPLAVLLMAGGVALITGEPQIFVGALPLLGAFYLFVQVFKGKTPVRAFMHRLGEELRAGKLSFVASLAFLVVVIWGGFDTLKRIELERENIHDRLDYSLAFFDHVLWWLAAGVGIIVIGRALDELVREHRIRARYWEALFFTFGIALFIDGLLAAAIDHYGRQRDLETLLTAAITTKVLFGGFLITLGLIAKRYALLANGRHPHPPRPSGIH